MNHSTVRRLFATLTIGLLVLLAADTRTALAGEDKPNIIFILADDLGYGDLSCYGQRFFKTPNLDRMAKQGMKFTQHYSGSTVCAPSRACLMTGHHTGHVWQRANGKIRFRPDPQDITIATLLKDAGYHTALIGKSGLACNDDDPGLPNTKGFDHFFGFTAHGAAHRYYPTRLARNGKWVEYPNNKGKEGDTYSGDLFLADALKYIEQHKDGPFFLHLSLQQPHADLAVPHDWRKPFIRRFPGDKPFKGGHYRAEQFPRATFAGMVTYLDDTVGQVLAKLKELGIDDHTLVIFSSDNGAMSEGGWSRHNFVSSGPLRGGKRDLYEGGIRVPTIAWWPGKIKAGSRTDLISAHWDFVPTACDAAGIGTPAGLDGISYLPTLLGDSADQKQHAYLYWEFYEGGAKQAVRMGKWKGVRLNVRKNPNGPIELYDLSQDLGEKRNVAKHNAAIVKKIAAIMDEAHVPNERFSLQPK